jgi:radical SAM superfamily enzyme YgiQ (UPF0313 family)
MKIALLNIINPNKTGSMDKDLAGGMGTFSNLGSSWFSNLLSRIKQKYIRMPVVNFAYLAAILRAKEHEVGYLEGDSLAEPFDLVVLKGTIVDYRFENQVCEKIKKTYPGTRVIFFGAFPSAKPELFASADAVIVGDELKFFQDIFSGLDNLPRTIKIEEGADLDALPAPDFTGFPIKNYSYFPSLVWKPLLYLIGSQGCPFSCAHYCAYGAFQGNKYRRRSPEKLIGDMRGLKEKYGIKAVQFRDPTFGLNRADLEKFCFLLKESDLKIRFGIETRIDILDKGIVDLLYAAGLRNINVGVETSDKTIADKNRRKLDGREHQEELIAYCEKIGVKVAAFYIFGLVGDTRETIRETVDYAIRLNTHMARFGVSCPYPGTKYYEELESSGLITETNFEKFDSFSLVFKHENLSAEVMGQLLDQANKRYYLRFGFMINFIRWRIREFWS